MNAYFIEHDLKRIATNIKMLKNDFKSMNNPEYVESFKCIARGEIEETIRLLESIKKEIEK